MFRYFIRSIYPRCRLRLILRCMCWISKAIFSPKPSKEAPLLFAGRIAPEKGVEEAIEIAAMAGHRLLIAGGIYDRRYYEERIEPKLEAAGERVTYLGQLERLALWKIMGQSLGLIFPVEWDEQSKRLAH